MLPLKSVTYSLPYLLLLSIFLLLSLKSQKGRKSGEVRLICLFSFFIFFGLRGFVGYDWTAYSVFYENLEPIYGDWLKNFETVSDVGFTMFATIIKSVFPTYSGFLIINVLIDCIVLNYIFQKYSTNYAFSFAVYLLVCMGMEMDTLRSLKALEIYLLSLQYIKNRDLKKFILFWFISSSFHASAILYLPTYWILNKAFKRSSLICYLIIINVIYLIQLPILKPALITFGDIMGGRISYMVHVYLNSDVYSVGRGISPSYLERLLTSVLIIYYYPQIQTNKDNALFVNMFWIYLSIVLLGSEMIIIESRVGNMFIFSYTIVWPSILSAIKRINNYRIVYSCLVSLCLLFVTLRTNNVMYLYENQLLPHRTYDERYRIFLNEGAKLGN